MQRHIVKLFILPRVDYALLISPCPNSTLCAVAQLDREICAWILAVPVRQASLARAER